MSAHDLGIKNKVWVNRGHEPANPYYGYVGNHGHLRSAGRRRALTGMPMKFLSYWHDTRPGLRRRRARRRSTGIYDVAVIGGGFTGLGAARHLAKAGAQVVVLEAETVGWGASGRNGGHLNNGLAHSFLHAKARPSAEKRASRSTAPSTTRVDTIERIIAEEGIDCDFRRAGKLKLASKPQHFESHRPQLRGRSPRGRSGHGDADGAPISQARSVSDLPRRDAVEEERDDAYGPLCRRPRRGRRAPGRGHLREARRSPSAGPRATAGSLSPRAAGSARTRCWSRPGAYTTDAFGYFRRRIVSVGSFIIATRPLTDAEIAATMPGNRTCVTSMNIGNYFRLSPDNRLIFGGRARFSAASRPALRRQERRDPAGEPSRDLSAARRGRDRLLLGRARRHDQGPLPARRLCRWRLVRDGLFRPRRADRHPSGHDHGRRHARPDDRNPLKAGLDWPAVPGHFGKPWFLPLVGAYYKALDYIR